MENNAQVPVLQLLIMGGIAVFLIASLWKVFTKAGHPGWACLVPIYNVIVLLKIANKPAWWLILMFVPIANLIVGILVAISVAKSFGKGAGFGLGLAMLPVVFYPVLAFGDSRYSAA